MMNMEKISIVHNGKYILIVLQSGLPSIILYGYGHLLYWRTDLMNNLFINMLVRLVTRPCYCDIDVSLFVSNPVLFSRYPGGKSKINVELFLSLDRLETFGGETYVLEEYLLRHVF